MARRAVKEEGLHQKKVMMMEKTRRYEDRSRCSLLCIQLFFFVWNVLLLCIKDVLLLPEVQNCVWYLFHGGVLIQVCM